jgi:probable rRNA maturation factor
MAECMLEVLGLSGLELSILLTNDKQIQQINRAHRDKDKPTDVLSFPQNEFVRPEVPKRNSAFHVLGDVVISIDTAAHQAQGRHRPLVEEVRFLLAHGLLHLLGHDHLTPAEKKVMTARTRYLVRNTPLPASVSAR